MLKFLAGFTVGAALAFGYVHWGISVPEIAQLPDKLRGNIVSAGVEGDLYDLSKPIEVRRRALEVFFQNRPQFAAEVDAEFGHPFLNALYLKRVIAEARQLRQEWPGFDKALAKPGLRAALQKMYGTTDQAKLKQAMLFAALKKKDFLDAWIAEYQGAVSPETLLPALERLSAQPDEKDADARR